MCPKSKAAEKVSPSGKKGAFVYILGNKGTRKIYVGLTFDLRKRMSEHRTGQIQGYAKKNNLDRLVWFHYYPDVDTAQTRQVQMEAGEKGSSALKTIDTSNPNWNDLSGTIG